MAEPFALVLYWTDPDELMGTFWNYQACLDYDVLYGLGGMCITLTKLAELNL